MRQDPRTLSLLVIGLAWALVVGRLGGAPLHDLDPSYLQAYEAVATGGEALRPARWLSWALVHAVAHLGCTPGAWAEGRMGIEATLLATTIVPLSALAGWLGASAAGLGARDRWLAAAMAACGPTVWGVAGIADTLPRWIAATLVLGVVVAGIRGLEGRPRSIAIAAALQILAMAWHPAAVVGPAVGLPLWLASTRGRWGRLFLLGASTGAAALAWVLATGQGSVAAHGFSRVAGVPIEVAAGLAHVIWQLPGAGWAAPRLPVLLAASLGAVALAVAGHGQRGVLWLGLGALCGTVPEVGAAGFVPDLAIAWTLGTAQAGLLASVTGAVAVAALWSRFGARPVAAAGLIALALLRAGPSLADRAEHSRLASEAHHALTAGVLVPAAHHGWGEVGFGGDPDALAKGLKRGKWLAERPVSGRVLDFDLIGGEEAINTWLVDVPGRRVPEWIDGALWESAVHACQVWMGRPFVLDGPCNPPAHQGEPGA